MILLKAYTSSCLHQCSYQAKEIILFYIRLQLDKFTAEKLSWPEVQGRNQLSMG